MDIRLDQLKNWLADEVNLTFHKLEPASADASFRRYFRATTDDSTLIVMDAPPEKEESEPFVKAAKRLAAQQVHTPQIFAQNLELGFLVLEDFGDKDYLSQLTSLDAANRLYSDAIDSLIHLQQGPPDAVERYSETKLRAEMSLFDDWYLGRHLKEDLNSEQRLTLKATKDLLVEACLEQPQVWVHRDFHSRNLMVTPKHNPGVIDFQDMVTGPIAYDLASLLKDCYIQWPREQQLAWLRNFHQRSANSFFSFQQLTRWFDFTAFQRHLKVLGIFCRLNYRDGKAGYLKDLPLVSSYCLETMERYDEFSSFNHQFKTLLEKCL